MKVLNYLPVLFLLIILSCGTSKPTATHAEINSLNELIQKKHFRIELDRAYPQTTAAMQQVLNSGLLSPGNSAGNISLIGNSNFLKISGDSITSYLPYFGERQMQVQYGGGDSAIEFHGIMENYSAEKNKDNSYSISFEAKSNSENFKVYIKLFPNLKSDIMVSGNSRFPISYSGIAELIQ